ncbi:MAG: BTAD domain-containing putative transcriptional regulator [Acidobacteriaceae bacterium]
MKNCFSVVLVLMVPLSISAQRTPGEPHSKPDASSRQMQLRIRLQFNPHDKDAHEELIKLLSVKYAFRPEMEEDGTWLKNNPEDYDTEIEMHSLATIAVDDPEYAISIDRFILAHAIRTDDPKDYDFISSRLAFILIDRNHDAEALDLLTRATVQTPNDPGAWENLADAQVRIGQAEKALPAYRKSIDLDPTQEFPYEGLAKALFKLGRYSDCETQLKAAISVYNAQYHGVPTDTFHLMMKNIQQATRDEPALADLHAELAHLYIAEQNFGKALAQTDVAANANPDDNIPYEYLRAAIYDRVGQAAKAAATRLGASAEVQAEMKKEPGSRGMAGDMAYPQVLFMANDGDDEDSASEVVNFLEPHASGGTLKPMDLITLGFADCTLGKAAECNRRVQDAFRADGKLNTAKSEHNLAEALVKAHDAVAASEHFRQAYELDPQNTTYRMDYESTQPH